MSFSIGVVQRCAQGEVVCGDGWFADETDDGLLVCVVDGLGHGPKAGEASDAFIASVRANPARSLESMMSAASQDLVGSRGAAAGLLRFDAARRRVEFTGVGNIEVFSVADTPIRPVCAPGIVGAHIRKLLPFDYELSDRALVAIFSDGISSHLHLADYTHLEPQALAEALLAEHGKAHDDATCVVILHTADHAEKSA
jgi:serine/threonine protein phosphatase PrpC